MRETREETGFTVEIVGIVGTYTNPRHVFAYNDGEVLQESSVCFLARPVAANQRLPRNPPRFVGSHPGRWTRSRRSQVSESG
ncbi:NUDIX hydrolase [Streptomyces angustmyceticus]|uniref:hypothetical protein n=1 Tax=Streptomyces angustmyceticus TaxID=285578 RepID=UPI0036F25606